MEDHPPVLIDGRYPAVEGYRSLSADIQKTVQGPPEAFQTFLHNLHLHAAVVKYPSTEFIPDPFSVYFPRKEWALIYWDDLDLIFVERTPESEEAIQKYEFRHSEPDSDADSGSKV